jgi:TPP-dependent pyruvate/acetoin dehydrogenase alpha subunit
VTYRWRGHVGHREDNDVGVQRKEGLDQWKLRDPISRLVTALVAAGILRETEVASIWTDSRQVVEAAWQQAVDDPYPPAEALLDRVYFNPTV